MARYTCQNKNVIIIEKGQTYKDSVTLKAKTGEVLDLTGASATSEVRNGDTGTLMATFTVTVDSVNQKVKRELADTVTSALPVSIQQHVWGLVVTMADGTVLKEIDGGVTVKRRVVGGL